MSTGRAPKKPARKTGLTILESVLILFIFSLLLVPTGTVFHRSFQSFSLETGAKQLVAALELARASALHERKEFQVVFTKNSFAIYREGKERLEKVYRLPKHVQVVEKTEGFDPVVFRPDGTSSQAGHLILRHERTGQEKRLVLYNLSGRCLVR
ncbi:MAG: GspH/FimT family protein [Candidatus Omnitrophica bacterium]|nr:GspH/FimT family protein [Candidatus Omnitrophota bacterium]